MIIKNFRAKWELATSLCGKKNISEFSCPFVEDLFFELKHSNNINITHKIIFIQPCRAVLTIVNSAYLKKKRPMGHITHLNSIIHFKISFIESYTNSVDKEVDYSPICFINDTRLGCKRGLHNYTNWKLRNMSRY